MEHPIGLGTAHGARRGAALLASFVVVAVLFTTTWAVTAIASRSARRPPSSAHGLAAESLAEAGISEKISQMIAGNFEDLGSAARPAVRASGSYWVRVVLVDQGSRLHRLTSRSSSGGESDAIETVVRPVARAVFRNAIFAGNSSGDPSYELELGGAGRLGDRIRGDVYSGGGVTIAGSSRVDGAICAARTISGARGTGARGNSARGTQGSTQPQPDFAGLRRGLRPDFDVAAMFADATRETSLLGGSAGQMPRESPAHVFRKNPSDREGLTRRTPGDDYFLEDPYENIDLDPRGNADAEARITLSGLGGEPGPVGGGKVYFVAGDLWIHNRQAGSIRLDSGGGEPGTLTIVVQGDIHLAGNVLGRDRRRDGLALIAIRDPARRDSGNILLGDPGPGELSRIDAFLFAENDVRATGLEPSGQRLAIEGRIVAGNQIRFGRDPADRHVAFEVSFEDREKDGAAILPGLPRQGGSLAAYAVVSWRRVSTE